MVQKKNCRKTEQISISGISGKMLRMPWEPKYMYLRMGKVLKPKVLENRKGLHQPKPKILKKLKGLSTIWKTKQYEVLKNCKKTKAQKKTNRIELTPQYPLIDLEVRSEQSMYCVTNCIPAECYYIYHQLQQIFIFLRRWHVTDLVKFF